MHYFFQFWQVPYEGRTTFIKPILYFQKLNFKEIVLIYAPGIF